MEIKVLAATEKYIRFIDGDIELVLFDSQDNGTPYYYYDVHGARGFEYQAEDGIYHCDIQGAGVYTLEKVEDEFGTMLHDQGLI